MLKLTNFAAIVVSHLALGVPALALSCSSLSLPTDDLGARIDTLGACLNELSEQYKQECQKPIDDLTAAALSGEGELDKYKKKLNCKNASRMQWRRSI